MRVLLFGIVLAAGLASTPAMACRLPGDASQSLFERPPSAPTGTTAFHGRLTRTGPEFDAAARDVSPASGELGAVELFAVLVEDGGGVVEVYKSNILLSCDSAFRLASATEVRDTWIVVRLMEAPVGVRRGAMQTRRRSGEWVPN